VRDLVDINSNDVKHQNEIEVPFLKGAYVSFWSDVDTRFIEGRERLEKELDDEQLAYWSVAQVVADWNLSGADKKKLEITKEVIAKFSPKLRTWLVDQATKVIFPIAEPEKKKESPSS